MTEQGTRCHRMITAMLAAALALLAGCTSPTTRAPVEDRAGMIGAGAPTDAPARPLPGAENEGKPGYYTVRKGDTLIRIGLESGQNWRDVARWNNLENPNAIEVGQVIRIAPPVGATSVAAAVTPPERGVVARPLPPASAAVVAQPPAQPPPLVAPATPPPTPVAAAAQDSGSDDEPRFIWPTGGSLLAGFDEQRNKGLDIGGRPGDAVLAAADGRVVYSGAGLRGYGNLIILKHNNTFLTAYAHNRALLVKEDQSVQKGQKIAEMGDTDADRVKLHFEIRRQGKSVDPARYLPAR